MTPRAKIVHVRLPASIMVLAAAAFVLAVVMCSHTYDLMLTAGVVPLKVHLRTSLSAARDSANTAHCGSVLSVWQRPYLHPALNFTSTQSLRSTEATAATVGAAAAEAGAGAGAGPAKSQHSTVSSGSSNAAVWSSHLITPRDADVAASRQQLQLFLDSSNFEAEQQRVRTQQQQQQQQHQHAGSGEQLEQMPRNTSRGILIVAGGKKLTTHLIVLLHVLRKVLHCSLPVDVAWLGPAEMNDRTWASLKERFGPLSGFDVQAKPYPKQHRRVRLKSFIGKVAALLHCSFQEVLLLDADNIPLVDPALHFEDPLYRQAGNLFWPDFWSDWVKGGVWGWAGLNHTAVQPLLSAGAGWSGRDAESGMLLVDRRRWLAVLHWVFWVNTWHDRLYNKMLHGDKDTFALGFALAGHADQYRQVVVPPGGVFKWAPGQLEVKCQAPAGSHCNTTDGWQLLGALQHDNTGRPVFFHRTINKLLLHEQPWPAELLTGPLPKRWVRYHIAHNSQGPTKGVGHLHAAPPAAFQLLHFDPVPGRTVLSQGQYSWQILPAELKATILGTRGGISRRSSRSNTGSAGRHSKPSSSSSSSSRSSGSSSGTVDTFAADGCPVVLFSQYFQAVQLGLPVDPQPDLECACRHVQLQLQFPRQDVIQLLGAASWSDAPNAVLPVLSAEYLHGTVHDAQGKEVPDGSAVAALKFTPTLLQLSGPLRVIRESHAALEWLKSKDGISSFPALFDGSMA